MEAAAGIAALVGLLVVVLAYDQWKRRAVQSRSFTSPADPELIRDAFERKVATTGWKIVDDGNPMIAQSPLIAGIRQQVALALELDDGIVRGEYATLRHVRKVLTGTPTKAVTLAARKSSFFRELDRLNVSARHQTRSVAPAPPSAPPPAPPRRITGSTASPFAPQAAPVAPPVSPFAPHAAPVAPQAADPTQNDQGPGSARPWYADTADEPVETGSPNLSTAAPSQDEHDATDQWWTQ